MELKRKNIRLKDYDYSKKEGIKAGKKEDARKMKEKNIPIETIVEITGLTKEEIEKL